MLIGLKQQISVCFYLILFHFRICYFFKRSLNLLCLHRADLTSLIHYLLLSDFTPFVAMEKLRFFLDLYLSQFLSFAPLVSKWYNSFDITDITCCWCQCRSLLYWENFISSPCSVPLSCVLFFRACVSKRTLEQKWISHITCS